MAALRRSQRTKGSKSVNYHEESESDSQSDNDDDGRDKQLLYRVRMRAADPRYLTPGDDGNRGDILLTMASTGTGEGTHNCEITLRGGSSHSLADHIRDGILSDGRAKHSCMNQGCEIGTEMGQRTSDV